jgi:hypothetical protein
MNPVRIVDAPLIVHDCEVRTLPSRWPSEHVVLLCSDQAVTPQFRDSRGLVHELCDITDTNFHEMWCGHLFSPNTLRIAKIDGPGVPTTCIECIATQSRLLASYEQVVAKLDDAKSALDEMLARGITYEWVER